MLRIITIAQHRVKNSLKLLKETAPYGKNPEKGDSALCVRDKASP